MVEIEKIKELRGLTGASIADCKEALEAVSGDIEKAVLHLRKTGQQVQVKRGGNVAKEGVIGSYMHTGGKICTMVELNCETDFVARNEEFKTFAHELAMHIAAAHPLWLSRDEVPQEKIDQERSVILSRMNGSKKPPEVMDKIVTGKLDKFFRDTCLLEQMFIKDTNLSIEDKLDDLRARIKENIVIKRFMRFEVGS